MVSGLKQLDVNAQVSGTIKAPKLSVRSNLDDAIAQRLKAVVGEEVAKAEALARAKVDSIVADKVEPVKQRDRRRAGRGHEAGGRTSRRGSTRRRPTCRRSSSG